MAAGDGDIIDVIDTKTMEVTRTLDSGPDPELMAIDPAGKIIYIANEDDSLVTIMDIESGDVLAEVPVGVEPEGMAVSPDSKYTVATSESTSMAHVIDNAHQQAHRQCAGRLPAPRGEVHRRTARSFGSPRKWAAPSPSSTPRPGRSPRRSPSRCPACGLSSFSPSVWISPATARSCSCRSDRPTASPSSIPPARKSCEYILVGQRPWHGELGPDGKKYYVANGLTNDLTVIDVDSLKAEKSVPGRTPALGRRHHAVAGAFAVSLAGAHPAADVLGRRFRRQHRAQ